jgi:glycosyltransferase involved in cell wall biosynthesis
MLTVIIPSLNAETSLSRTLAALLPGMIDGVVREVILVDGGSTDRTVAVADAAGVDVIHSESGRGRQLIAGAEQARHNWMLFLHSDTVLADGWHQEARRFMLSSDAAPHNLNAPSTNALSTNALSTNALSTNALSTNALSTNALSAKSSMPRAAAFKFALDDVGVKPRIWEHAVAARCAMFRLPYGDQGLLIPKSLYRRIGGYRPMPLMEDVDIIRRLKSSELHMFDTPAITSAVRFQRDGYAMRSFRNLLCLAMYYAKVSPTVIERRYQAQSPVQ